MNEIKLGVILDTSHQRDAIHVAVAPVIAAETLYPGQHIGFVEGSTDTVAPIADGPRGFQNKPAIGIVDPFLTMRVLKGERCWMFLYPGTITSLRHDWTHPAFESATPAISEKVASEAWLRNFCATADCPSYERIMAALSGTASNLNRDYYESWGHIDDDYLHFSGSDAHGEIPAEFWHHVEIVLGKKLAKHPSSFSCSC